MPLSTLLLVIVVLTALAFQLGRRRSIAVVGGASGIRSLHSLPNHYGYLSALWCVLPALAVVALWVLFGSQILTKLAIAELPAELRALPPERLGLIVNDIKNLVSGNVVAGTVDPSMRAAAERYRSFESLGGNLVALFSVLLAAAGALVALRSISASLRARIRVERAMRVLLFGCSTVAVLTTVGIVLSVLFEAIRFFQAVPIGDFLFGLRWSPQTAIRADQVGSSGAFGAVPLFTGTLLITVIAIFVAVPIGLMSALYLSEYASPRLRSFAKPLLEVLAGVPTVVYGYFAALTVAPFFRDLGMSVGLDVSSESALAAGVVMGVMIIPFVSSLSDDVINAVPQTLRDGSLALGATQSETVKRVILPAALPGIVGGVLLAISRAIGETMIVVMAAGLSANLTANPLDTVTTVTVQIVTLLVGDQEFDSPKTLAAFALGLVLFLVTLILNIIALHVVRRYREQYE